MRIELTTQPRHPAVLGDPSSLTVGEVEARRARPVALVTMPFVSVFRPSIQIGLLKPIAESHGFPAETFHLNLDLARQFGVERYESLCDLRGNLIGDWLFSKQAFGNDAPDPDGTYVDDYADRLGELGRGDAAERWRHIGPWLREARDQIVPSYLDQVLDSIDWGRFAVVGFTSTFQQSVASFALARALKVRWPHLVTLFGGANFDGPMGRELTRSVAAVDLAISGEADVAFPQLLIALTEGMDPATVPGVLVPRDGSIVEGPDGAPFDRLDDLPVPHYDEYFDRAEHLGILAEVGRRSISIPYESARGCWWGAKRHCTFCGLNGQTMAFRAKQPSRVVDELATLAKRHRTFLFTAVDNIMEPTYIQELFPALSEASTSYKLFYEVKANLSRDDLRVMRAAGIMAIQPGIESLSSHVLALMRKGTRASTNVNLLRWARHYGITVAWHILRGFPGERVEDYEQQAQLVDSLLHLQPPSSVLRIDMERFSPIHADRETFPAKAMQPDASYRYVYPEWVALDDVAYFFDYELHDTLPDEAYASAEAAVRRWVETWSAESRPELRIWQAPGFIQIDDTRNPEARRTHTFDSPLADLYVACLERPRKAAEVAATVETPYRVEAVEAALNEFVDRKLMFRDGNLFLSLALPASGVYADLGDR